MKKASQLAWVKTQLTKHGKVSRNQALRRYISRLAARIADCREEGLEIVGKTVKRNGGKDYVYSLVR